MVALVMVDSSESSGSFLPATVVAELELNSVIPPPDTIEEEKEKRIPEANNLKEEPSRVKVNSKHEISEAKHSTNIGPKEFGPYKSVSQHHDVDSEVSRIKSSGQ